MKRGGDVVSKKDYQILWKLLGKNLWKNKKKFFPALFFVDVQLDNCTIDTLICIMN